MKFSRVSLLFAPGLPALGPVPGTSEHSGRFAELTNAWHHVRVTSKEREQTQGKVGGEDSLSLRVWPTVRDAALLYFLPQVSCSLQCITWL